MKLGIFETWKKSDVLECKEEKSVHEGGIEEGLFHGEEPPRGVLSLEHMLHLAAGPLGFLADPP